MTKIQDPRVYGVKNPGEAEKQIKDAIKAARSMDAKKKVLNLTPAELEAELKQYLETREVVSDLEAKLITARNTRDAQDVEGLDLVNRIVNAIKADETEGEDSPLLETMGYIIKSKRQSGLHRTSPESDTTPIPKAA